MAQTDNSTSTNSPYVWQPTDVSTFNQQSQNLGNQAQNAGINTGQIGVQGQTGQASAIAGQSGQNVAAGASQVAQGAQVTPTAAQASPGSPTIQPYQVTAQAPTAPSTAIQTSTAIPSSDSTFNPNTELYLATLFPQGIPASVLSALNSSVQQDTTGNYNPVAASSIGGTDPELNSAQANAFANPSTAPAYGTAQTGPVQTNYDASLNLGGAPNSSLASNNSGVTGDFTNYLNSLQAGLNSTSLDPATVGQFQNYLTGQLATGQQNLNQYNQTTQGNLAAENTTDQANISNYTAGLNQNLQNYTTANQDLSNIGQQSAAEQQSAAKNAILTGTGATAGPTAGTEALGAVTANGAANSRLGILSQQAQAGALQNAQGQATEAQNQANIGSQELASGQQAQATALTNAGTTINTNNTNLLTQLQNNNTASQQALTNAYNNASTNLSNQEQTYVNNAQQTLQQAQIPESAITTGVTAFASTIQNALTNNSLNAQDQANLVGNLEAIWRIAVGTNPSDMGFSNQIAGILNPILNQLNSTKVQPGSSNSTNTTSPTAPFTGSLASPSPQHESH